MRKISEPEAHRGRIAVIEGQYPDGMQARCAWCARVEEVQNGQFCTVKKTGEGPAKLYKCSQCLEDESSSAA